MVLIAPAVDFTEELMWARTPDDIRNTIMSEGVWLGQSAYSPDPTPITRKLIEDGRKHLMFGGEIRYRLPGCVPEGAEAQGAAPRIRASRRSVQNNHSLREISRGNRFAP